VHRRGGRALDHADAGNNDLLGAHPFDQPIEQHATVGQTDGLALRPGGEFCSRRPGEVPKTMTLFDRRQLFISGGSTSGEQGDRFGVGADLFCDMIEHGARQEFAAPKISAGVAQATELKRVTETGLGHPALGDRREIVSGKAVMTHDLIFCVRQFQKLLPLHLRHRYPRRHRSSLHKPLALRRHNERGL